MASLGLGMAAVAAVGCFEGAAPEDDVGASGSRVSEGARSSESTLLKSTLLFEGGCSGVKVGPKLVLTAARCVAGSTTLVKGGSLSFVLAPQGRPAATTTTGTAPTGTWREVVLADVHVAPSFVSRCREDSCGLGALVSSDAADVAVLELSEDLTTVPALPVDLDAVKVGDPLFVAMSECATLDSRAGATVLNRTVAAPPSSVNHTGSPYASNTSLVSRLGSSYVVTSGPGWDEKAPGFCRSDVGGPVFRTNAAVVVGITAGLTLWSRERETPVTLHHTRLDDASREKVGTWLKGLGVETLRSCSESTEGCADRGYDGGAPRDPEDQRGTADESDAGDAGLVDGGTTATRPQGPRQERLEVEEPQAPSTSSSQTFDGDAGTTKKKAAATGGCSTAPGGASSSGGLLAAFGLAALVTASRRRRARG